MDPLFPLPPEKSSASSLAVLDSEERFRLLVESVRDYAIFLLDPDGRVTTWNAGAERIKGYHPEEIIGQHFSRFYPPEDVAQGKPDWELEVALQEGRIEDEGWRVRKDGTRFWANVIITAVRDAGGELKGFAKVTRDLTERRRAEAILRQQKEELVRTNADLETFSYSVSHDLRSPLRAIDGFAQALLEDHAPTLDSEAQRLLASIRDNAQRMGQLIDALLSFSRLGRKDPVKTLIDMTALAESVVAELRPGRGGKSANDRAAVHVRSLPGAPGDGTLVRQVLANLVSNAFKFSSSRSDPRIEIGGREEGAEILYWVKDNGTGFDMQYADRLFRVFSRLHRVEEFEGTGVGLALVQRIVQRHGGRVWGEGRPNEGATFFFTLPKT